MNWFTKFIKIKFIERKNRVMEEKEKHGIAIVVVAYNTAKFIQKQVELIRKYSKDAVDIVVVDNSTDGEASDGIKYHSERLGCKYYRTHASSKNGSDSHAFAANYIYAKLRDVYKYFFYLDHDAFPVKPFSVKELLNGITITGMGQNKDGIEYFWTGCVMWDNEKVDNDLINFTPNHELKLDTGGPFYKIIEKYGKAQCPFMDEIPHQNPHFNKSMYNFYVMINSGMFLHAINGSNWNPSDANEERLNSLMNILEELTA